LQRCREVGPDRAFVELIGAVDVPPEYNSDIQAAQAAEAQYQRTNAPDALEEAIVAWDRILQHPGFPASPERFRLATLNNAGNTFLARYSSRGVLDDLDRALALWRTALPLIPPGSPDRPRSLVGLSSSLYTRYQRLEIPLTWSRQSKLAGMQYRRRGHTPWSCPPALPAWGSSYVSVMRGTGVPRI
jgi:hypothetical protein